MTFKDMFSKSSDNAKEVTIDTTSKMKDMHNEVVKVEFTPAHEKEIHHLEVMVKEIRDDINKLFDRVAYLEKQKRQS